MRSGNRLTASRRHRVLLLEAGPADRNLWLHIPLGYGKLSTDRRHNWCYATEPQPECAGREVIAPRGKVLGGSSSINGLIYIRGQAEDFNQWRQLGNTGWATTMFSPTSESRNQTSAGRMNCTAATDRSRCRTSGTAIRWRMPISKLRSNAVIRATTTSTGRPRRALVITRPRCAMAAAARRRARANLTVVSDSLVSRLLFEGRRAIGVEYFTGDQRRSACANAEVIVASGTFNSPQLLQLSGLGPAALLKSLGIAVSADMPGVGQELTDHFSSRIVFRSGNR